MGADFLLLPVVLGREPALQRARRNQGMRKEKDSTRFSCLEVKEMR